MLKKNDVQDIVEDILSVHGVADRVEHILTEYDETSDPLVRFICYVNLKETYSDEALSHIVNEINTIVYAQGSCTSNYPVEAIIVWS